MVHSETMILVNYNWFMVFHFNFPVPFLVISKFSSSSISFSYFQSMLLKSVKSSGRPERFWKSNLLVLWPWLTRVNLTGKSLQFHWMIQKLLLWMTLMMWRSISLYVVSFSVPWVFLWMCNNSLSDSIECIANDSCKPKCVNNSIQLDSRRPCILFLPIWDQLLWSILCD